MRALPFAAALGASLRLSARAAGSRPPRFRRHTRFFVLGDLPRLLQLFHFVEPVKTGRVESTEPALITKRAHKAPAAG